ncbi:unnamed protein product [Mytilus edulis]|uniref:DNA-directed DNA polymerase n=1 Tax=Mytilus edulis TaxID=6550 RepID=A0A8S3R3Q5_MYTED|nr:unnamed protein product [Mytilus edulis]
MPEISFYGGRTNAIRLHHEVTDGSSYDKSISREPIPLDEQDVSVPVGHPDIIHSDFSEMKDYFGIALLKENVLYHDTDSVIYIERRNAQTLSLRDYLGDFTDELEGHYIEEFVSGGPKHYAYRRSDGQEVCKVRGFSLNYENQNSSISTPSRDCCSLSNKGTKNHPKRKGRSSSWTRQRLSEIGQCTLSTTENNQRNTKWYIRRESSRMT